MPLWFQRESKISVFELQTVHYPTKSSSPLETSVSECCLGFKETATEYCLSSSLHGLQYMGRTGHYRRERWFWLLTLMISTGAALYLIVKMYLDYSKNPVETVFDPTPRRMQELIFPAITLCNPDNWLSEASFVKYTREIFQKPAKTVLTEDEIRILAKLSDMVEICAFGIPQQEMISAVPKLKPLFHAYKNQIESLSDHIQTIADESEGCEQFIPTCSFKFKTCIQQITGIVTDKGYCCVFNAVPINQLTTDMNETNKVQKNWAAIEMPPLDFDHLLFNGKDQIGVWPFKQTTRGKFKGLIIVSKHTALSSICPREGLNRTYVYVTSQLDLPPLPEAEVGYVEPWDEVEIKVKPDITLSDYTIKFLSKDKRKCYYDNEYKLQWHKHYTQANCIEECRLLDILTLCNCTTSYGLPFKRFCNRFTSECHIDHERRWRETGNLLIKCPWCLPTCTEIDYNTDSIKSKLTPRSYGPAISQVLVNMDFHVVHPKLRKQSMTTIQLLSNAGGLLGLFMGFSVFSLLELLYYSTLCIRRARGGSSSTI